MGLIRGDNTGTIQGSWRVWVHPKPASWFQITKLCAKTTMISLAITASLSMAMSVVLERILVSRSMVRNMMMVTKQVPATVEA